MNFKKYIEESNETFNNASLAQQRIMIAQDVLLRIKYKNIVPDTGSFINKSSFIYKSNGSIKDLLNNGNNNICVVCAKGSLFMSLIGRINNCNIDDIDNSNDINNFEHNILLEFFSKYQLDMVEIAFEGVSYLNLVKQSAFKRCIDFYYKYNITKKRLLIAICKNIITNQGEFIP